MTAKNKVSAHQTPCSRPRNSPAVGLTPGIVRVLTYANASGSATDRTVEAHPPLAVILRSASRDEGSLFDFAASRFLGGTSTLSRNAPPSRA
jgi:hypothetical protein